MKKMNDQNKSAELMKTLEEFSKQNKIMDMKDELINETLSEALEGSDDEAEEDAVVNQGLWIWFRQIFRLNISAFSLPLPWTSGPKELIELIELTEPFHVRKTVLDEIGIEITGKLAEAKSAKVEVKQSKKDDLSDDFIEKELAKLRMG